MKEFDRKEIQLLSKTKQWCSAIIAAFGGFGFGLSISWTATALPSIHETRQIGHDLSNTEKSLIGAMFAVGALIACPSTALAMNRFGRKTCMLYLSAMAIPGWLVVGAGRSTLHLCFGRLLTGIYAGGCTIVVPVYVKEISSSDNRGALGSLFLIMLCVGKLIANIIGVLVSASVASLLCAIQPTIHAICILTIPESRKTVPKQNTVVVSTTLSSGEYREHDIIDDRNTESAPVAKPKFSDILIMPVLTAFVLATVAQLCGVMVVTFFTNDMLKGDSLAKIINPDLALVTLTAIQLVGSLPTSVLVDRCGRKFLALSSLFAMSLSMAVLSAYFCFIEEISVLYPAMTVAVPLTFIALFNIAYSWGIGSVVFIIISEIIPSKIIALISSLAYTLYWTSAFVLILLYQVFFGTIPLFVWFLFFCIVCLSGAIFVMIFLPETKGLDLEEIQKRYKRRLTQNGS